MRKDYYSGLPYSDELYHYGVKGQKWGVRRYQYKDGTRTPEGKIHYGYANVTDGSKSLRPVGGQTKGNVAVRAASRLGEGIARGVKSKLAEKMPFMLNDEELKRYRDRVELEASYQNARANKRGAKQRNRTDSFLAEIAKNTVKDSVRTATSKATNAFMDRLLETEDERENRRQRRETADTIFDIRNEIAEDSKQARADRAHIIAIDADNERFRQKILVAKSNRAAEASKASPDSKVLATYDKLIKDYGEEINRNDRAKKVLKDRINAANDSIKTRKDALNSLGANKGDGNK